MQEIFEIASRVSTPLALGGFLAAVVFFIFRQILKKDFFPTLAKSASAEIIKTIIDRLFVLALVAMVLGFAGYILPNPNNHVLADNKKQKANKVIEGPPLQDCKPGTIDLNLALSNGVERDICLSSALRSEPIIEEETKINGVTNSLKWHVFDATGKKPIAVCYCYQ